MSQMSNIVKALSKVKETEKEEKPKMELVKTTPETPVNFTELLKGKLSAVDKDKIAFEVAENAINVGFKNTEGEIAAKVTVSKKGKSDAVVKVTLSAETVAKGKTPEQVIEELVGMFQTL